MSPMPHGPLATTQESQQSYKTNEGVPLHLPVCITTFKIFSRPCTQTFNRHERMIYKHLDDSLINSFNLNFKVLKSLYLHNECC